MLPRTARRANGSRREVTPHLPFRRCLARQETGGGSRACSLRRGRSPAAGSPVSASRRMRCARRQRGVLCGFLFDHACVRAGPWPWRRWPDPRRADGCRIGSRPRRAAQEGATATPANSAIDRIAGSPAAATLAVRPPDSSCGSRQVHEVARARVRNPGATGARQHACGLRGRVAVAIVAAMPFSGGGLRVFASLEPL